MKWSSIFGGGSFEDAATSGAVAISVPVIFAPLLLGRWERVNGWQQILMLDNKKFKTGDPFTLPFRYSYRCERYIPFVLPPSTGFSRYKDYRIPPTSNAIPQIIAIFQILFASRQIYLNYRSSVLDSGLSSPYLIVIPYLLMSVVNLVANTLCSSYTHVTMLPMDERGDCLPDVNEIYITGSKFYNDVEGAMRVLALSCRPVLPVSNAPQNDPEKMPENTTISLRPGPVEGHSSDYSVEAIGMLASQWPNNDGEAQVAEPRGLKFEFEGSVLLNFR